VDALQAEWAAGGWPGRKEVVPPPKEAWSIAEAENAWSRKTRRWADLKFMDELECAPALDRRASSMTSEGPKTAFVEDLKVQLDELKVQLQNGLIPSMQAAGNSSIRQDQVGTTGRSSVRQDQGALFGRRASPCHAVTSVFASGEWPRSSCRWTSRATGKV
jgi:hypothetical protein